ncbi:MAG: oxidative damage protection protein [Arenicellales bacterium]
MPTLQCVKLNKQAEGLDKAPWPGELGERILANISKEAWMQWLGEQTILINENNYSPINPEHKAILKAKMEDWLFGEST